MLENLQRHLSNGHIEAHQDVDNDNPNNCDTNDKYHGYDEFTTGLFIWFCWATTDCGFLRLIAQFEKVVIGAQNPPDPDKIAQCRQLTGQWKSDVIDAVLQNPPERDKILQLHDVYGDKVLEIFLGGPDTIPGLLNAYSQGVKQIFELGPRYFVPEPTKRFNIGLEIKVRDRAL